MKPKAFPGSGGRWRENDEKHRPTVPCRVLDGRLGVRTVDSMKRHFLRVIAPALIVLASGCSSNDALPETPSDTQAANNAAPADNQLPGDVSGQNNAAQDAATDGVGSSSDATVAAPAAGSAPGTGEGPVDDGSQEAARDAAFADLDTLRQNAGDLFKADPKLTDTQLRDAVLRDAKVPSTLSADGDTGIKVTFVKEKASCFGVIVFKDGGGTWQGLTCN